MSDFLKRIAGFSPKRLLLLAAELEERVHALETRRHAPIAIVGIGCRFPGGISDGDTYWNLLKGGRDAITEVPAWRWNVESLFDPDPHAKGKIASRWGGFVDSPELFDNRFFGIAPIEALAMDPQQRLLLEVSWEALENAGIAPSTLNGSRTGVYVGLCNSDYAQLALQRPSKELDAYFAQGASHAVASGRLSYFLGLRGPSLSIDTACSSSLVAIHQACQSLRLDEIDMALAGGVNLLFSPQVTMALSRAQMMAPDGRCKPFSAEANGFVRSEGCGVVVLKRMENAIRDGDNIMAIIRGSAVNQDGRSSGITAPNGPSQEDVIRAALADGNVPARAISYVEAHGTGTNLGDPIELRALDEVLGKDREKQSRLPVGSVKSNFGHAEAAAGIAGLIKVVLCLKNRQIPASLHFMNPNPAIDWESNRLRVPIAIEPWAVTDGCSTRIGAVSSFGFSGTNAHLILEEAPACHFDAQQLQNEHGLQFGESNKLPDPPAAPASEAMPLFALSARTNIALRSTAQRLANHLRKHPHVSLADAAYTLATGRSFFAHRAAIRPGSLAALIEELELFASTSSSEDSLLTYGSVESRSPRVAFLFPGQGSEHTGMGLSLLEQSAVFRAAVAEVDAALLGTLNTSIATIFRNEKQELSRSFMVQPALFAFQLGLARMWQSWGIEPHVVAGHSMGQIVAATVAGVMSVADAALLIAARGRLTGELGDPGGMVAVAASEEAVLAALAPYVDDVSIAAINGMSSVVISGRSKPLELATRCFERSGIRVKRLNITFGSHSPAMGRVLPEFYEAAGKVDYHAPLLPILADLNGDLVTDAGVFNAQYFTQHLIRPVQFYRCLKRLEKEDCGICIELGPRPVLATYGKNLANPKTQWIASANGREPDYEALKSALGEAFAAGVTPDWTSVFGEKKHNKIALPTYPFERERFWIEPELGPFEALSSFPKSPALPQAVSPANSFTEENFHLPVVRLDVAQPTLESVLKSPLPMHLNQHCLGNQIVLPASFFIWLALRSAEKLGSSIQNGFYLEHTKIGSPISIGAEPVRLQVSVAASVSPRSCSPTEPSHYTISSRGENQVEWITHAATQGKIHLEQDPACNYGVAPGIASDIALETALGDAPLSSRPAFTEFASSWMNGDDFYRLLENHDIHLGEAFRGIQELWFAPGRSRAKISFNKQWLIDREPTATPHPALLDACFQALSGAALSGSDHRLKVVTGIERVDFYGPLTEELIVEAILTSNVHGEVIGSLEIRNPNGFLLIKATGIELREFVAPPVATNVDRGNDWVYAPSWDVCPLPRDSFQELKQGENPGHAQILKQWILLGDPLGIAGDVAQGLRARGEAAEAVQTIDPDYISTGRSYELADLRCVDELFALSVADSGSALHEPVSSNVSSSSPVDDRAVTLTNRCISFWKQAIADRSRAWIFTLGSQPLRRMTLAGVSQSPLWGLARCATLEHPDCLRRIVDLDPTLDRLQLVQTIKNELLSSDLEEQIAYSGSTRLAYRVKLLRSQKIELLKPDAPVIQKNATYLVTGGAGTLGSQVVQSLVDLGAQTLVITSRSLDSLDAHKSKFEAYSSLGIRIIAEQVDVSSLQEMSNLFARFGIGGELPPLRGVFHLAAEMRASLLDAVTSPEVESVLNPKVKGTWVLHELTRELSLDFFVAFSSTAAVFGASNLSLYSAANCFVDSVASLRSAQNLPYLSVSWGIWQTMRRQDDDAKIRHSLVGMKPMHEETALDLLWRLVSNRNLNHAIIADIDWNLFASAHDARRRRGWLEYLRPEATALSAFVASWQVEPGESRLASLERAVQKESARVLGFRRGSLPDMHARLSDLGLDSLMAVNLRNRFQLMIGRALPATFAFEYPTPADMALALDLHLWSCGVEDGQGSNSERDEIRI